MVHGVGRSERATECDQVGVLMSLELPVWAVHFRLYALCRAPLNGLAILEGAHSLNVPRDQRISHSAKSVDETRVKLTTHYVLVGV